nr:CCA tRNA nucleotidyltransferase [uncultured Sphingosinicella sp.]
MKLPQAPWRARTGMRQLLDALGAASGDTRYVGGAIRDTLLEVDVSDVDLATRLAPETVMERLKAARIKAVPTGLAHGTVTAVIGGAPVEVTTLRRDVSTDGRRATIAYTDDWQEDAARRDFTINALYADPIEGEVFDFFGGLADLEARRVRFIGDPLTRIAEDHLRILRFFRFHARLGAGDPDRAALEACTARANDLMALSRERIADELLKLLGIPDPTPTVKLMVERGILKPVLPEIGIESISRLKALVRREAAAGTASEPLRRLAALLPADPQLAATLSARLRLSNRATKRIVSAADRKPGDGAEPKALAYRVGVEEAIDRLLLSDEDEAGLEEKVRSLAGYTRPPLPVSGGDLIQMGLSAGPIVAKTLQAIEREWIEGGFALDNEGVRQLARTRVDQALRASQ